MAFDDCVFCKIVAKKMPCEMEYEDDEIAVFWDINPQAPVHLLIVPKDHIVHLTDFTKKNTHLLGRMMEIAEDLAQKMNLLEKGYRVVLNEGKDAGQSIFHFHLHILGGRRLMWPPG